MNARLDNIIYYEVMRNAIVKKGRRAEKSKVDDLTKARQDVWFVCEIIFIMYADFYDKF